MNEGSRNLISAAAFAVVIFGANFTAISEWQRWERLAVIFVAILLTHLVIDQIFWKVWGVPKRPWFKRRQGSGNTPST